MDLAIFARKVNLNCPELLYEQESMESLYDKLRAVRNLKTATHAIRYFKYRHSLSSYFRPIDLDTFRTMQSYTKALIVGKSAMRVLMGTCSNDHLELSVARRYARCVASFLLAIKLEYIPNEGQQTSSPEHALLQNLKHRKSVQFTPYTPLTTDSFVFTVLNFRVPRSNAIVQVIVTDDHPLQFVFCLRFSHDMAFVSASHTFMLFPKSTFLDQITLDFAAPMGQSGSMQDRSFGDKVFVVNPALTATDVLDHTRDISAYVRRIGDSRTWTSALRPLAVTDLDVGSHDDSVPTLDSWQLIFAPFRPPIFMSFLSTTMESTQEYFVAPAIRDLVAMKNFEPGVDQRSGTTSQHPITQLQATAETIKQALFVLEDEEALYPILLAQLQRSFQLSARTFPSAIQPSASVGSTLCKLFLATPALWNGAIKVAVTFKCISEDPKPVVRTLTTFRLPPRLEHVIHNVSESSDLASMNLYLGIN
ncbi:hypothetical protein VNI00_005520 [Paramarasmius palmivorus]|uniref:Uncharacterized protein n=1 Tax=Paramarasmius palmivorus TaxID=297713 RepID=A0AAW0DD85_9AGAR